MWRDDHSLQFNFKFSQCNLLDETTTTTLNMPSTRRIKDKKKAQSVTTPKRNQIQEQAVDQPVDVFEKDLRNMEIYEAKLSAFCGIWEDFPRRHYRMKFCIEMGQLVGYSTVNGSKALVSYDGYIINMIIVHSKESGRPLDHYRGRLGWNQKYINWEKEDISKENGWRPTRKWVRIE